MRSLSPWHTFGLTKLDLNMARVDDDSLLK